MGYTKTREGVSGGRARDIKRVLWLILGLNVGVALAKLLYGLAIDSVAMTADGFHSMFDGTSNVIGLVGMSIAMRPADDDHPYGHTKYETFASLAIGLMLVLAAWRVGVGAIERLMSATVTPRVDAMSFAIMLITLAVNIGVTTYERREGHRLGSEILIADASHTGSDIFVSLGVIGGLAAVRLGFPIADPIIGLVVAGFIVVAAIRVFKSANMTLSDRARMLPSEIRDACVKVPGVLGCHDVRTRGSAAEVYVDLHVQVDPQLTVAEGHRIAEDVERRLAEDFDQVVDVIAHLEPYDAYQRDKTDKQSGETL